MLKENRLRDACTSYCSFPCSGGCPHGIWSRSSPDPGEGLGRCTLFIFLAALLLSHQHSSPRPAPPGLFLYPFMRWVSLGSGENYQWKCCCLTFSMGCGGSLHRWQPCLLAAWHHALHVVPAGWHPTARPGHLQCAASPSSGAALPLSSSGTAIRPSCHFLFPAGLCGVTQRPACWTLHAIAAKSIAASFRLKKWLLRCAKQSFSQI